MNAHTSFDDQIIQGDCTAVMPSMPNNSIDLIATDFPYLVGYKPRDGRTIAGDRNDRWLLPSCAEMFRVLKPDSFCFAFFGWPEVDRFMTAWKRVGFRPVSHFSFVKKYYSRRGYSLSFHETAYLLVKGRPPRPKHPPADTLPFRYTGNRFHPNEKPVETMETIIKPFSRQGDVVLDPFAGSGTTGLAARNCHRHFTLIEKMPRYFHTAQKRLGQSHPANVPGKTDTGRIRGAV